MKCEYTSTLVHVGSLKIIYVLLKKFNVDVCTCSQIRRVYSFEYIIGGGEFYGIIALFIIILLT